MVTNLSPVVGSCQMSVKVGRKSTSMSPGNIGSVLNAGRMSVRGRRRAKNVPFSSV